MNQAPRDVDERTGDAPRMENSSADGEARDAGCERLGRTKARAYLTWQWRTQVLQDGSCYRRWGRVAIRRQGGDEHQALRTTQRVALTTTGRGRRPIQAAFAVNDAGGRNAKSLPPWRSVRSKLASPSWVLRLSPEGKR